jgi:hypothetical protein
MFIPCLCQLDVSQCSLKNFSNHRDLAMAIPQNQGMAAILPHPRPIYENFLFPLILQGRKGTTSG